MPRPLIAITLDSADKPGKYALNCEYAAAVEAAGGLPVALPYQIEHGLLGELVDRIDGILFTGGDDMNPARYGEEWHPQAIHIDADREKFEFALIAEVERRRVPALGICFGSQLMNVHRGGSLHQFLPDVPREHALEHRKLDRPAPRHAVAVDTATGLGAAIGRAEVSANTYHKQGVRRLGRGLRIVAKAPDGVIEAFEDPEFPLFAAVQWHPERLRNEAEHAAVFKLLVERAAGGM